MNWFIYALLSAVFAAITAILAKIGVKNVDSNLATAVRTLVILVIAWGIVFFNGQIKNLGNISKVSLVFLTLSGIATGLSWLFYFRALQLGEASKVAPVDKFSLVFVILLSYLILKEKITLTTLFGTLLITVGTVLISLAR